MKRFNAYREARVYVMGRMCATCVFRPGNLMHLPPGRLEGMVRESEKARSAIICHDTLGTPEQAVCRGFFDKHPTAPLQIAERIGVLRFQEPSVGK